MLSFSSASSPFSPNHTNKRPKSCFILSKTIKPNTNNNNNDNPIKPNETFQCKYNIRSLKEKWKKKLDLNYSFYDTKFPKECIKESIKKQKEEMKLKTTPDILCLRKKDWNSSVLADKSQFSLFSSKSIFDLKGYIPEKINMSHNKENSKHLMKKGKVRNTDYCSTSPNKGKMIRTNYRPISLQKPLMAKTEFLSQLYRNVSCNRDLFANEGNVTEDDTIDRGNGSSKRETGVLPRKGIKSVTVCYIKPMMKIDNEDKEKDNWNQQKVRVVPITDWTSSDINSEDKSDNRRSKSNANIGSNTTVHWPKEIRKNNVKRVDCSSTSSIKYNTEANKTKAKAKVKKGKPNFLYRPPKPNMKLKLKRDKEKENKEYEAKVIDYVQKKSLFQKAIKEKLFKINYKVTFYHPGVYRQFIETSDYNNHLNKEFTAWSCCLNEAKEVVGCTQLIEKKC